MSHWINTKIKSCKKDLPQWRGGVDTMVLAKYQLISLKNLKYQLNVTLYQLNITSVNFVIKFYINGIPNHHSKILMNSQETLLHS